MSYIPIQAMNLSLSVYCNTIICILCSLAFFPPPLVISNIIIIYPYIIILPGHTIPNFAQLRTYAILHLHNMRSTFSRTFLFYSSCLYMYISDFNKTNERVISADTMNRTKKVLLNVT